MAIRKVGAWLDETGLTLDRLTKQWPEEFCFAAHETVVGSERRRWK